MREASTALLARVKRREIDAEVGPGPRGLAWVRAHSRGLSVVAASGSALALGLIRIGAPSIWFDEAFTANAVHQSPGWWLAWDPYHVLYDSVATAWASLAGTSEWALRMPSVVGSMAACGLLVVLVRKLFEGWTALTSGLLLATSPFVVKWSQQARGYTLFLALSLLSMLLLIRALDRNSRASWAIYGIGFTAVVTWHAVAGLLLIPAHAVLIAQRRKSALPHGPLAAVIICALVIPWAAVIALRTPGGLNWLTAPTLGTVARAVLDISGAAGLGLLLAVIGLWVLHNTQRNDNAVWLSAWAFGPFVLALLFSTARPVFLDRYLIGGAPAFALLAAVAVTGLGRRLRLVAALAAVVATSVGLAAWYSAGVGGNWRGEDWRSASSVVLERRHEGDAVVVAPWAARPAALYYGVQASESSTANSIWLLTWSETGDELGADQRRALGLGDHDLVERLRFGWRLSAEHWRRER